MNLIEIVQQLFQAHGLNADVHNDWVIVDGQFPAVKAYYDISRRGESVTTVMLTFEILFDKEAPPIVECFAGLGHDLDTAVANGVENFCLNSLHVLLSAFWNVTDESQVSVERWEFNNTQWKATVGNFSFRNMQDHADLESNHIFPENLFGTIEKIIRRYPLTERINWVRTFYCNVDSDRQVAEFLLNNDVQEDAQQIIAQLDWPRVAGYYSLRNFLILEKITPDKPRPTKRRSIFSAFRK